MIIGICGLIGSGKGTVAEYLEKEKGFVHLSFAEKLKDAVSVIFGWDRDMLEGATPESRAERELVDPWWSNRLDIPNLSPRLALQLIGTEAMRNHFADNIWVAATERLIDLYEDVVISDVRFPNEIAMIKSKSDSHMWQVWRGDAPHWWELAQAAPSAMKEKFPEIHPSEYMWAGEAPYFDEIIYNSGTVEELHNSVSILINGYKSMAVPTTDILLEVLQEMKNG